MGLIDNMKERIKKSGTNKKEVLYFAADSKRRIRFLQELDEGFDFTFHSNYPKGIYSLCLESLGKDCPYCQDEEMVTITNYAFSVFDYDTSSVKILLHKATGISPIPAFIEFYETYGTIMDRDYIVKKIGKGMGGSFVITPCDREKFKNSKATPYNKKQIIKILAKAFPTAADVDDDDEEEVEMKSKKKSKDSKTSKKKEPTLKEKLEALELDEIKEIAISIGLSKKEIKGLDEEELVELLLEDYEEDDIKELYEEITDAESDDEDDDDE